MDYSKKIERVFISSPCIFNILKKLMHTFFLNYLHLLLLYLLLQHNYPLIQ